MRHARGLVGNWAVRAAWLVVAGVVTSGAQAQPLGPPPPAPAGNPPTEAKRVLGKILFWDEQLSADGTTSCGTCHLPSRGGGDGRRVRHPGADGTLNTPDDAFGSPGVAHSDELGRYVRDVVFGLAPQVTNRAANSMINAAYAPELFWDGRASGTFVDPVTGQTLLQAGAALESQVVGPPVNSVEMGHDGIDWSDVTSRLATSRPMALATNLPPDVLAALSDEPNYRTLFARAFGDGAITAARIAMAIATYERTLIANDTPWDRFVSGQPGAMTPQQVQGWNAFQASNCHLCHVPPQFTGNGFRNIGVRPPAEDLGRQLVTNNPADRGRFKVPGLRNVGLKTSFMHNGQFTNLTDVIRFYARAPGAAPQFPDNRDPLMNQVNVPPQAAGPIEAFLIGGLTDPRVAAETFPFDRPTLYGQRATDRPTELGGGQPGTGDIVPRIVALDPPMIGNGRFRIGLDRALGGARARLIVSTSPAVAGKLTPEHVFDELTVEGEGAGSGFATQVWPLNAGEVAPGQMLFAQWVVEDPAAAGGEAYSTIARIQPFCPTGPGGVRICPPACEADFNASGLVSVQDIFDFLEAYFASRPRADVNISGDVTVQDVFDFLAAYFGGC